MKERIILIDTDLRQEMMAEFGVVSETVRAALAFETETYLARKIREYALEHGAKVWVPEGQNTAEAEEGKEAAV